MVDVGLPAWHSREVKTMNVDFMTEDPMRTNALPLEPLAAAIYVHIDELRREAQEYRAARAAQTTRTTAVRLRWPVNLVATVRASLGRPHSRRARRGEPCPAC
jgi:hypothetical protein